MISNDRSNDSLWKSLSYHESAVVAVSVVVVVAVIVVVVVVDVVLVLVLLPKYLHCQGHLPSPMP